MKKFIVFRNIFVLVVFLCLGLISLSTIASSETESIVINGSTIPCMQSGVIFGYASLVDGMIERIKEELHNPNLKIIATGGLISLIAAHCKQQIHVIANGIRTCSQKHFFVKQLDMPRNV